MKVLRLNFLQCFSFFSKLHADHFLHTIRLETQGTSREQMKVWRDYSTSQSKKKANRIIWALDHKFLHYIFMIRCTLVKIAAPYS